MSKPKRQTQLESFIHAFEGFGNTLAHETHMKVHVVIAVAALCACGVLGVDATGWCLVILCIGAVFSAELFNSALEALCDKACPEIDPLIKTAKDASAAAVLVLALASVVVGLIVYIPALVRLFGN